MFNEDLNYRDFIGRESYGCWCDIPYPPHPHPYPCPRPCPCPCPYPVVGPPGPIGPQGPAGPQGSIGPQGLVGPTGPTGPANGLNVFAGRYNNADTTTNITSDDTVVVALPLTTNARNASYTPENSITVGETGTYFIDYSMVPRFNAPATLTFAVRSNGVNLASTESTVTSTALAYSVNYAGNTIVTLPAGAVIDVAVGSSANVAMTFSQGSLETLNLYKLD